NIMNSSAPLVPLALGMMLSLLVGGIDLSVVGVAALTSVIAVTIINNGGPSAGSFMAVAFGFGFLIGLVNGILIVIFRIPSFAVTLGTAALARGFALAITNGGVLTVRGNNLDFLGGSASSSSAFSIAVGLAIAIWIGLLIVWVLRTRFGLDKFIQEGWQ